jgi:alpha-L-rhamnosidase
MATHNHAMFAGACSFITERLFGLTASENAYKSVSLRPILTPSVNRFSLSLHTVRGVLGMSYVREGDTLTLTLSVPFGCTATLILPSGRECRLSSGVHVIEE